MAGQGVQEPETAPHSLAPPETGASGNDGADADADVDHPDDGADPDDGQGWQDNESVGAPPSAFSTGLSVDDDDDSGVADIYRPSSSVSAASSVYEFKEEFGRTYHSYKSETERKYYLPNDIPEQERLDLQHSIALRLFGKLSLAPITNPKRVIDLGTGTGIWAIEFANEHPQSEVLGTDLSPIQPDYVPPNCHFEIDDGEDEWVFSHPFDYVHARFMCGGFRDFPKVFKYAYDSMNPGGWIEFQDYFAKMQCVDDSLRGTALERWNDLFLEAVAKTGKSGLAVARFKSQMQEAGFVDVVEKKFALPGNAWAKGREEKMLGTMQMMNILDGIDGFSLGLFTKILGMEVEEVEKMLIEAKKDLRNRNIHFYYIVMSVYGRKPE